MSKEFQYCFEENEYIQEKLEEYFEILSNVISTRFHDTVSILLVGSLSRGEGTWIERDGKFLLISDIEYFVICSDEIKSTALVEEEIKQVNNQLFSEKQTSAFHIDYTFMHASDIPRLEKKLMIFEAKKFGKTIVGRDYTELLPDVNIQNISFHDIKDIVSHRLFSMIYYGTKCSNEQEYTYLLAKNSLDLMTVYLAGKGFLEGGFFPRYELLKAKCDDTGLISYFGQCLAIKMGKQVDNPYQLTQMREIFLSLCDELYQNTKIPVFNSLANIRCRIRRIAGIIKRALRRKTIASFTFQYKEMRKIFLKGELPDKKLLNNHFVLYGYPK